MSNDRTTFDAAERETIRAGLGSALADVVLSDFAVMLRTESLERAAAEPGGPETHLLAAVTACIHDLTGEIPAHAVSTCLRDLADEIDRHRCESHD